jgi:hypothetical protein
MKQLYILSLLPNKWLESIFRVGEIYGDPVTMIISGASSNAQFAQK